MINRINFNGMDLARISAGRSNRFDGAAPIIAAVSLEPVINETSSPSPLSLPFQNARVADMAISMFPIENDRYPPIFNDEIPRAQ